MSDIGAVEGDPYLRDDGVTLCRDMFIPKKGQPTSNGGKPFPFFIAEEGIDIEVLVGDLSRVRLTLLVQGIEVEG